MAPHKLPKSLFKITLAHVETLVNVSCRNIEKAYGSYDDEECRQNVVALQEYLLTNIPGIVLDEVCDGRTTGHHEHDLRISLAVYMHANMRKFSVSSRAADLKLDSSDGAFWVEHLARLPHLVALDLHLVCTDEILQVVGANCLRLEQINIVSKMEPVNIVNSTHEIFNALKLKFFVSDNGLRCLCNCKLLKKVTMNKILRSQYGGRMMTVGGIRELVKALPNLQIITYDDLGLVISEHTEDVQQLSLTHLSDCHPRPHHVAAISRLCPNLQHLCLQFPSQTTVCTAFDILQALADSQLRVSVLELVQFPFCAEMATLLEAKGSYLRSLLIHSVDYISADVVRLIGQSCPSLKNLHLKQLLGEDSRQSTFEPCDVVRTEQMFRNLHCLYLGGRDWNPSEVLPLCLLQAKQLETLTVLQMFHQDSLDDVMAHILRINPLRELKAVHMFTGQILSMSTMRYFYKNCPGLTELSFLQNGNITFEDVKSLHDEVYQNNLDLKIYTMQLDTLTT